MGLFSSNAGNDTTSIKKTVSRNKPKAEVRKTCGKCNGAGRTGSEFYDKQGNKTRVMCRACNGVGQVNG